MKIDIDKLNELKQMRVKTSGFIVFFVLVVMASIFTIKNSIIKPEEQTKELFTYKTNNNVKYQVHLNANEFYEEKILEMNRQYATDLVKKVEIDFVSNLEVDKAATIDYSYEIKGDINGKYTSDTSRKETELWNRKFTLLARKVGNIKKGKKHQVNETIMLDFPYYNRIVTDFKKELRLNIDATFDIEMSINYKIKIGDETIKQKDIIKMSIPLNRSAFEIKMDVPSPVSETIMSSGSLIINYIFIIPAIIFLIVAVILFIRYFRRILTINKKTEYQISLNKILKNFGDVIAESETAPNFGKYDILNITKFEDLMDIQNEVRIPIIYFEKVKGIEGLFTLIHGDQMYRYVLRVSKSASEQPAETKTKKKKRYYHKQKRS